MPVCELSAVSAKFVYMHRVGRGGLCLSSDSQKGPVHQPPRNESVLGVFKVLSRI